MRVISGKYRGKKLQGFDITGTRPTMDRVKESLFGMIQDKIPKSHCLDLFAGSGALGIEALSMGALSCDFVDNNIISFNVLKENTKDLTEKITVVHADYKKYLKMANKSYDVIFLDPPYQSGLLNKALKYISEYDLLNENGIIICEYENEEPRTKLTEYKMKNYGTKKIKIFVK